MVAEGIVDKAADLDVATVMSMGFPAFRGGLIFWADLVGAAYVEKRLNEFAAQVRWQCVQRCRVLSPGAHPCDEGSHLLPLRSHCVPCPLNRALPPSNPQAGRPLRALRHPAAIVLILCPSPPPSFPSPSPPLQVPPKLAGFFKPCDYLVQAARTGRKLGDGPNAQATSKM